MAKSPPAASGADLLKVLQQAVGLHQSGQYEPARRLYRQALNIQPGQFDALHLLGVLESQQGRHAKALELISDAVRARPTNASAQTNLGLVLDRLGRHAEALAAYDKALGIDPNHADALHNRGAALSNLGRLEEALASLNRAVAVNQAHAEAWATRGRVLDQMGRHAEAVANCDTALSLQPDRLDALNNRGNALLQLGRLEEALASLDRALAAHPGDAGTLNNRGRVLVAMNRIEEALASYDAAIGASPSLADALSNRADALYKLGRYADALASCDKALARKPDHPPALNNRGAALEKLNRSEEALACYDRLLALDPANPEAWLNHSTVLLRLGRIEEALSDCDRALALRPDFVDAHNNKGNALAELMRMQEAVASYDRALAIRPEMAEAWGNRGQAYAILGDIEAATADFEKAHALKPGEGLGGLVNAALLTCDWPRVAAFTAELPRHVAEDRASIQPFTVLGYDCSHETEVATAKMFVRHRITPARSRLWRGERYAHEKIRLAYVSADFRTHPVAALTAELFETHDRARFELTAISYGADEASPMRERLRQAFDRFEDVRTLKDIDIARRMREMEIDIAIDLGGYTQYARPNILAHRPAPVQVSYLGYPGTMGADFIDCIIADPTVLPSDQQPFYAENIVHLPDCYMVSDGTREIAAQTPSRAEAGLPDSGFVFCSFNNSFKITGKVFDVWMRLLKEKEGSVLWLRRDTDVAMRNLRAAAEARGISADRIIFAERVPIDQHYARHRLADLFLDTLPYNAHTTASDALWAGLPVLTCMGDRFQGRVAASLLKAIGLPELITTSLQDYEALARKLMNDPALLKAYHDRLAANRLTTPLFDTPRFTRNLEAAFTRMVETSRAGGKPKPFAVAAAAAIS